MQLITQQAVMQVSGGKAESVSKRAEDIVSDLTKIHSFSNKIADQLERLEENIALVKNKLRSK